MPERLSNSLMTGEERQALLAGLPVFAGLSLAALTELASLVYEVHYIIGETIVEAESLVDSVFILAKGDAEVSQVVMTKSKITQKEKMVFAPLAIIHSGDAIGLNDTGFFSKTGKRTAFVTALSDVILLKLELAVLHEFLRQHPELQSAMLTSTAHLLKIKLIKQSLPFNRLSHERLEKLATQVEELFVPAGTIIFKEGEQGDRCYLIRSGKVDIIGKNDDGIERHFAILKSPTLFGEATFITHSPRNATARALVDCELLVLPYAYLSELIETEENVANMFMTLMVDRSRPQQNPRIIVHHRLAADKQTIVILKNPDNGNYFKLSAEGWFIWQQINDKQTMQEITLAFAQKWNIFAPDVIVALISKLAKAGFIINLSVNKKTNLSGQPFWVKSLITVRQLFQKRIVIGDADKWLTMIYQKGAYVLFTRKIEILLGLLAIAGFIVCGLETHHVANLFKTIPHSWVLFLFLIPFTMISIGLHELGHALATKSFGFEVHYMGIGWEWLRPIAFTDTSDMWLSTRAPRIAVNLAGIGTDIVMAGIASLLLLAITNTYIQAFLWIFAVFTYINAFRMLSPLEESDGYYILMDILDRPHLRHEAVVWLVKEFPKSIYHPSLARQYIPEISYWIVCIIFLMLVSFVTYFVQGFVLNILGIHLVGSWISLALPVLFVVISSLGVIADIRSQAEE